ncbi:MAG: serine/threonine-protein phosphatase [Candidatus Hydrogenedentota bacterium]|nr:MAG: serine/threonine-protein phosphatase [Candidatus Hydrogenedentota bacterium]
MVETKEEVYHLEKYDDDGALLKSFQRALHPGTLFRGHSAEAVAAFRPAHGEVGGDLYDILPLPEDRCAFLIGDVTGHSSSSAFVMAVLYGALREAARHDEHPCRIFEDLHNLLADLGRRRGGPRLFSATLFLGILSPDGTLRYSNAGHPSPILFSASGEAKLLEAVTPPLGLVAPDRCTEAKVEFHPGDRFLLYTDGVLLEGGTPERLIERVSGFPPELRPEEVVNRLVEEGDDDDRTAVLIEFKGAEARERRTWDGETS